MTEPRVTKLESDVGEIKGILARMDATMTRFGEPLSRMDLSLARVDERLRDMPSAKEFGELKGRVGQLPTAIQMVGFIVAMLVASGLMKHFLP